MSMKKIHEKIEELVRHGVIKEDYYKEQTNLKKELVWLSTLGKRKNSESTNKKRSRVFEFQEEQVLMKNKFPLFLLHVANALGIEILWIFELLNEKGTITIQNLEKPSTNF